MTALPLGVGAYDRSVAREPEIKLINRYFESNPTNLVDGVALLSRPGTSKLADIGVGRVRALFAQEGTFDGDLFVVSGSRMYRYTKAGETIPITGALEITGDVSVAATATHLFIADG
ncbi:MAG: hypothetical protein HC888_04675, partial [Candidatus Competibacteraceae bacterium]|nr:hypothetical protein [Candidatus Competibacteraceae bacterium]